MVKNIFEHGIEDRLNAHKRASSVIVQQTVATRMSLLPCGVSQIII